MIKFAEMANPNDNMDDATMDVINSGANPDPQGEDDGRQYFVDYEELVGDNPDQVYLHSSIYVYIYEIKINDIYTNIFILVCVAL